MCGIVGYMGYSNAVPFLLNGLEKLEYRGYDSAGIAVHNGNNLRVVKESGKLSNLEKTLEELGDVSGNVGIGHTRWATHGVPSVINAHPHVSESGAFALVHNGIIENYIELRQKLEQFGKKFVTDTDTEVLVQLIEYNYNGDFLQAVSKTLNEVRGSYAIAVLCEYDPEALIVAKNASPLVIGVGKDEFFVASDVAAFAHKTKNVIRLSDKEIAFITPCDISVYTNDLIKIEKKRDRINFNVSAAEKGDYEYFMLKEIYEQPRALRDTIMPRVKDGRICLDEVGLSDDDIFGINKIEIIGCGSAYHVGCIAKYIMEQFLRKSVEVDLASEFRYRNPIVDEHTLLIAISQSGETADTLAALREGKRLGAKTLSIVNVQGSSIANESDHILYTHAGQEVAVATTKAYSTQLAAIYMLTLYLAEKYKMLTCDQYLNYVNELCELPEVVSEVLKSGDHVKNLAKKYYLAKDVFFIGRNIDYSSSLEGSLKLKEISYIHSEAYAAGELKHGTISLIEDGTLVVSICTLKSLFEKMISNVKEVKARGAVVLSVLCDDQKGDSISNDTICIPRVSDMFLPVVSIVPLQLFSYYIALEKGCNVDKPKNLAKSVTVE